MSKPVELKVGDRVKCKVLFYDSIYKVTAVFIFDTVAIQDEQKPFGEGGIFHRSQLRKLK